VVFERIGGDSDYLILLDKTGGKEMKNPN